MLRCQTLLERNGINVVFLFKAVLMVYNEFNVAGLGESCMAISFRILFHVVLHQVAVR